MSKVPTHLLRGLTIRKLIQALERDGFLLDHQRGSHRVYYHPDGRRVVLPFHSSGQTVPVKTLKAIINDTGWTLADLKRLRLIAD
jgi:predicted RNA binding protein YcfA (HicA-like mRNA interferase family)